MPLPGPIEDGLFSLVANWGRTIIKTSDSEEGVFIHPTSDGGMVSLIKTETETAEPATQRMIMSNIKAVKLNANGQNDWVFSPSISGASIRTGVFILPNPFSQNQYLIGVEKFDFVDYDSNLELFYVNEFGEQIWQMEYPASGRDLLAGALFKDENTVMVYGSTNSSDGVFEGKKQSTGYDGFVLEIDTLNGECRQAFLYDFLERDNGIKRIYKTTDSPDLFFVGEAINASGVQKIWLMRAYHFNPTFVSQTLFGNDDDIQYFFGGLRRIGPDEYILSATKRLLDDEHMAFYKFTSDASFLQMVVEINQEYEASAIIEGDARERSIGVAHFTDGKSILAGVKAVNDVLSLNRFFLIDTRTFEVKTQEYSYREGVVYNHLSKKDDSILYGLTGSIPSDENASDERTAGGRACWVEGL